MTLSKAQVSWLDDVAPDAVAASEHTGVNPFLILAQWGVETGWGTSRAWRIGNNYAGVSPGGKVANYADRAAGLAAYERALNQHYYDDVRKAGAEHPTDQLTALAKSPWAAGHYKSRDGTVGGSLQLAMGDVVNAPLPAVLKKWEPGLLGEARPINLPGEGIAGDVAGAVGSAIGGLAAPFARAAFTGVFLFAALGLVVLGVYRATSSGRERVTEKGGQAAQVAALAAL
jgi:hypothetical protein